MTPHPDDIEGVYEHALARAYRVSPWLHRRRLARPHDASGRAPWNRW